MEISHNHLINKPIYPHNMVYQKIENLIKTMQHNDDGVSVKSQKLFLTTITNAFTGQDLIEWMKKHLEIEEQEEALHLATLLARLGYFFCVNANNSPQQTTVKDDGDLYRFQAPYFWVSTNWNVGNTDYAIYLVKRTMRNQEKHALSDQENQAIETLRKKLTHQWDFIKMQADAQIKILKDRKKADKAFIDSQERAFWHTVRPPGDTTVNVLEEDMRVTLISSSTKSNAKMNEQTRKKIAFLEQSLKNRVRTKASQTLQGLCAYNEAYNEYDGLFGHCLPSNPWITDDTTMWDVSVPLVDVPTQLRVKKWSFSFPELLRDPTGVREFTRFCQAEFSSESLLFYLACQEIKETPKSQLNNIINRIFKDHLSSEATAEINVNDTTRNKIVKKLSSGQRDIFYEAEKHIYELMKKNSYPRFAKSEQYKQLLEKAIIPAPKKNGIFHFVTLDYFRHKDEGINEDSEKSSEEDADKSDYVAGGVYAPPATSISTATAGLTLAMAVGFKHLLSSSSGGDGSENAETSTASTTGVKNKVTKHVLSPSCGVVGESETGGVYGAGTDDSGAEVGGVYGAGNKSAEPEVDMGGVWGAD